MILAKATKQFNRSQNTSPKSRRISEKQQLKASLVSSISDTLKLNHELTVYQIELEIQNGELIKAKENLEDALRNGSGCD